MDRMMLFCYSILITSLSVARGNPVFLKLNPDDSLEGSELVSVLNETNPIFKNTRKVYLPNSNTAIDDVLLGSDDLYKPELLVADADNRIIIHDYFNKINMLQVINILPDTIIVEYFKISGGKAIRLPNYSEYLRVGFKVETNSKILMEHHMDVLRLVDMIVHTSDETKANYAHSTSIKEMPYHEESCGANGSINYTELSNLDGSDDGLVKDDSEAVESEKDEEGSICCNCGEPEITCSSNCDEDVCEFHCEGIELGRNLRRGNEESLLTEIQKALERSIDETYEEMKVEESVGNTAVATFIERRISALREKLQSEMEILREAFLEGGDEVVEIINADEDGNGDTNTTSTTDEVPQNGEALQCNEELKSNE